MSDHVCDKRFKVTEKGIVRYCIICKKEEVFDASYKPHIMDKV